MSAKAPIVREPRWPAVVAMLAAGCVYWALPEPFQWEPSWLLLAIILVLSIPLVISNHQGHFNVARILTFTVTGAITIGMVASLAFLIQGIPHHREPAQTLLRAATALWVTNVLVFALWYWKLDGGGPLNRETRRGRVESSFLFPQMLSQEGGDASWSPRFMDYLFLAFNTSTAFFADGYGCAFALGESGDDDAIADFVNDCCAAGGASGECFVSAVSCRRMVIRLQFIVRRSSGSSLRSAVSCPRFGGHSMLCPYGFNKRFGAFLRQAVRSNGFEDAWRDLPGGRVGAYRPNRQGRAEKICGSSSTIPACCSGVSSRTP